MRALARFRVVAIGVLLLALELLWRSALGLEAESAAVSLGAVGIASIVPLTVTRKREAHPEDDEARALIQMVEEKRARLKELGLSIEVNIENVIGQDTFINWSIIMLVSCMVLWMGGLYLLGKYPHTYVVRGDVHVSWIPQVVVWLISIVLTEIWERFVWIS